MQNNNKNQAPQILITVLDTGYVVSNNLCPKCQANHVATNVDEVLSRVSEYIEGYNPDAE
jgi:hypothetical protein